MKLKELPAFTPNPKGLSTGAWVGIGLGALILGGAAYYWYTSSKTASTPAQGVRL